MPTLRACATSSCLGPAVALATDDVHTMRTKTHQDTVEMPPAVSSSARKSKPGDRVFRAGARRPGLARAMRLDKAARFVLLRTHQRENPDCR